jgi:hypothetical protein
LKRAVAGFTSIPQTGSFSFAAEGVGSRWSIVVVASGPQRN